MKITPDFDYPTIDFEGVHYQYTNARIGTDEHFSEEFLDELNKLRAEILRISPNFGALIHNAINRPRKVAERLGMLKEDYPFTELLEEVLRGREWYLMPTINE